MEESTQRILDFIIKFKMEHGGNSPSLRAIASGVGLKSSSTVSYHLRILESLDQLSVQDGKIHIAGELWLKLSSDLQNAVEGS